MKKSIATILALAAAAASAIAQDDPGRSKGYELKNRSAFLIQDEARIPFWPIGFTRPPKNGAAAVQVAAKIKLDPSPFNVTSVLLGNPALVMINGRSFAEGELLPVVYGTERLRVVVRAIRDGGVTLDYEGQPIFVPIHRPELAPKAAQQQQQQPAFSIQVGPALGK